MKKIFLFFGIMLSINLAYSQCEMDFSNVSNVCHHRNDNETLKSYGVITDGKDTLFIKDLRYLSLHKVKCDNKKIGIWPSDAKLKLTGLKEDVHGLTISLKKTKGGNYSIEPVNFYYFSDHEPGKEPSSVPKDIRNFKEIYFSFEDGSSFKFVPKGNSEYVFISSGTGIAAKFEKFF